MASPKTSRIDVRLDDEHRALLDQIVQKRGITVSEFIRSAIEAAEREARLARVSALLEELQLPDDAPDDPPWYEIKEMIVSRFDDQQPNNR